MFEGSYETLYDLSENVGRHMYYMSKKNPEACMRECLLGTSCNIFEYDWSSKYCAFLPASPMKSAAIYDVLLPGTTQDIYMMHCSGSQENLVSNSDFFTRSRDPWVMETNCSESDGFLLEHQPSVDMRKKRPSVTGQYLFSYQVKCWTGEEFKLVQDITEMPFGIDYEYLTTIWPTLHLTHWFTPASTSNTDDIFDYGITVEFLKDGSEIPEMYIEKIKTYVSGDAFAYPYNEMSYLVAPAEVKEFDTIR